MLFFAQYVAPNGFGGGFQCLILSSHNFDISSQFAKIASRMMICKSIRILFDVLCVCVLCYNIIVNYKDKGSIV